MQRKIARLMQQKDDIITLILHEMQQENGSIYAIQQHNYLKNYENSKVVNYVKYFRRFADKNSAEKSSCSGETAAYSKQSDEGRHNSLSTTDEMGEEGENENRS